MVRRRKTTWTAVIVGAMLSIPAATPLAAPGVGLSMTATSRPRSGGAAHPTLSLGARGPAVTALQERLRNQRLSLSVDGRFGPGTRRAVQAFQKARGLAPDGVAGPRTWQALDGGTPGTPGTLGTLVPIAAIRPVAWSTIGARSYGVRRGDTLVSVAEATRSTAAALAAANRLPPGGSLPVGSTLLVPGTWRCPAPGSGFINDFGFPRVGHIHQGNDMFAPRGTPILAPVRGRVEQRDGPIGGHAQSLYGDDGIRYYFAHMDSYGAKGDVAAGTVIGRVGNSGNAVTTPTHLHFEIHPGDGEAVNPFPTITLACKR